MTGKTDDVVEALEPVTDADREASAAFQLMCGRINENDAQRIRDGIWDETEHVRFFTRLRAQSLPSSPEGAGDGLAGALERRATEIEAHQKLDKHAFADSDDVRLLRHAAAALRTQPPAPEPVTDGEVEGDIRIAIWNGARWQGSPQEVAQSLIRKIMEEPTMHRALAALRSSNQSPAPASVETNTVLAEMIAVATAEDDSQLADEWPIDCRAQVDNWQAKLQPALGYPNGFRPAPAEAMQECACGIGDQSAIGHYHESWCPSRDNILTSEGALAAPASVEAMREALDDAVATIAAVRATAGSDQWSDTAGHFYALCGETLARIGPVLSTSPQPPKEG